LDRRDELSLADVSGGVGFSGRGGSWAAVGSFSTLCISVDAGGLPQLLQVHLEQFLLDCARSTSRRAIGPIMRVSFHLPPPPSGGEACRVQEKNHGKYADLRALHDAMLSFGNAAPKYVKERLGI